MSVAEPASALLLAYAFRADEHAAISTCGAGDSAPEPVRVGARLTTPVDAKRESAEAT